jgi:Ca-activated chloride channel family protein
MAAGATGEGQFEVSGEPGERFEISLAIQKKQAPFDSPASAAAGSVINFAWRGPNAKGDLIFIMAPKVANNRYPFSNRHETAKGPSASITVPALPGIYEVRYFSMGNGTVLHRMPIQVTPAQVLINAPASIPAGTPMSFTWSGPASPGDVLFIANPNMDLSKYYTSNNHLVSKGDTARVTAPAVPGVYEVRYYSKRNGTVLFKTPLEVTEAQVTLDAPRTAAAGTRIEVKWSGPKSNGDVIFITEPSLDHTKYWTRNHNVSKGSPAQFTVPAKPGTYEIRYYSKRNGQTLAKRALIVR